MQTAMEYYHRAIERDSSSALGYAGLSEAYVLEAHYDFAPKRVALDSARTMAQRAVALDSTLPEARTALALSLGNVGQFAAAEREFRRAIDLGPSNPAPHYWYGMLLVALGRGAEGLGQEERALELDPFAPRAALVTKQFALYLVTGQRADLKLPVKERRPILKVEPGEPWARARDAAELAEEGRCDEARSDILRARQLVPDSNMVMLAFAGSVYWSCGERARARALLAQMKRRPDAHEHGMRVAILHTQFGEKDSALVWLGRHWWTISELPMLSGDRFFDPLRSDPRFDELLLRIGIRGRPPAATLSSR
jgi:Flp pilus assembly protein TadD